MEERLRLYRELVTQRPLEPVRKFNRVIDQDLCEIIESCLQVDPDRRPRSMDHVLEDLQRRRHGEPLLCRRPWSSRYQLVRILSRPLIGIALLVSVLLPLFVNTYLTVKAHRAISFKVKEECRQVNLITAHQLRAAKAADRTALVSNAYRGGSDYRHILLGPRQQVEAASVSPLPVIDFRKMTQEAGDLTVGFYRRDSLEFVGAWSQIGDFTLVSERPARPALHLAEEIVAKNRWMTALILAVGALTGGLLLRISRR